MDKIVVNKIEEEMFKKVAENIRKNGKKCGRKN